MYWPALKRVRKVTKFLNWSTVGRKTFSQWWKIWRVPQTSVEINLVHITQVGPIQHLATHDPRVCFENHQPHENRIEIDSALLIYCSSEPERDDRGSDQHCLHLRVAQPAHRRHLLLHHCPLHAPRLLRHLLRPPSQCNNTRASNNPSVSQSRRRPLLGTFPGLKRLWPLSHLRHWHRREIGSQMQLS